MRTQARALTMVEKLQVQLTRKEQERQVGRAFGCTVLYMRCPVRLYVCTVSVPDSLWRKEQEQLLGRLS